MSIIHLEIYRGVRKARSARPIISGSLPLGRQVTPGIPDSRIRNFQRRSKRRIIVVVVFFVFIAFAGIFVFVDAFRSRVDDYEREGCGPPFRTGGDVIPFGARTAHDGLVFDGLVGEGSGSHGSRSSSPKIGIGNVHPVTPSRENEIRVSDRMGKGSGRSAHRSGRGSSDVIVSSPLEQRSHPSLLFQSSRYGRRRVSLIHVRRRSPDVAGRPNLSVRLNDDIGSVASGINRGFRGRRRIRFAIGIRIADGRVFNESVGRICVGIPDESYGDGFAVGLRSLQIGFGRRGEVPENDGSPRFRKDAGGLKELDGAGPSVRGGRRGVGGSHGKRGLVEGGGGGGEEGRPEGSRKERCERGGEAGIPGDSGGAEFLRIELEPIPPGLSGGVVGIGGRFADVSSGEGDGVSVDVKVGSGKGVIRIVGDVPPGRIARER